MLDRSTSLDLRLYDASCLNSTSHFNEVVAFTQGYLAANPYYSISDLDDYMNQNFGFYTSGEFTPVSDSLQISIAEYDSGSMDTMVVKVVYQNEYETLCSGDGRVAVWLSEPIPTGPTSGVSISVVCGNNARLILALSVAPGLKSLSRLQQRFVSV